MGRVVNSPEPVHPTRVRPSALPQPEAVSDARTLIRIELQKRQRDVVSVPTYRDPETRRSYESRVDDTALGSTLHKPATAAVPKLRAPGVSDQEPSGAALDTPGGGLKTARGTVPASERLKAAFGCETSRGDEADGSNAGARMPDASRSARAAAGYNGFTPRLGPNSYEFDTRRHRDDGGSSSSNNGGVDGTMAASNNRLSTLTPRRAPVRSPSQPPPPNPPPPSRYYVPSLTLPPPEDSTPPETRVVLPGSAVHVPRERFKFGNTKGDTTRHILSKPEYQSEAHLAPDARRNMGRGTEHLDGQYYKLPNKIGGINGYAAGRSGNFAIVAGAGKTTAVTSNRTATRSPTPEPVEYRPWTERKPLKTLPPPLDESLGTTRGLEAARGAMTPREPAVTVPPDSPNTQNLRATSLGTVRISRRPQPPTGRVVPDPANRHKDERVISQTEATLEANRRHTHALNLDAKPPLKSRKVKLAESVPFAATAFERPVSPVTTGQVPGYAGHVAKDQVNYGHTLAHRSRKNYRDPFGVGNGTRDGLPDPRVGTLRTGDAGRIAREKISTRRRPLASFVTDGEITDRFPSHPALVKAGRTHVGFDPAIHTDTRANVVTTGDGGYPKAPIEPPEQTEERYHVPGYTGHVPKTKFKFANGYSDTTQHVMTKPGQKERRDVPFQAASGEARPEYGFLKLENRIEAKDPAKITRRPTDFSGSYRGHRSAVITPRIRVSSSTPGK